LTLIRNIWIVSFALQKLCDFMRSHTVSTTKRPSTYWERIFTYLKSDRGLISNIYKKLKKMDSRKSNNPIKKWPSLQIYWPVFFFSLKDEFYYLFYVWDFTVRFFRHTRRGQQIPLKMAVSHHVVAGNWTQDL
jgi:hypothetical protein